MAGTAYLTQFVVGKSCSELSHELKWEAELVC